MKILIVGLGSMGKRRARLVSEVYPSFKLFGVDTRTDRRAEIESILPIETFANLDLAIKAKKPDAVFVCTSPLSHEAIIIKCLKHKIHTFSEINLVDDGYSEIADVANENQVRAFLSSTPLYRKEINYIAKAVGSAKQPLSYSYHVGQYLPDWHPWESYNTYFVGDKKTNGCREIMAIELPWLISTFGHVISSMTLKAKISRLNIDFPDTFQILLEHENGNIGSLFFNIVSREAIRRLEIVSEELFIDWRGTPESLIAKDLNINQLCNIDLYNNTTTKEGYGSNIIEEPYAEEIVDFVTGVLDKTHEFKYSYEKDKAVIKLINKLESE